MHERKLFREVERLDAFDSLPDLVATVSTSRRRRQSTAVLPFLTLGIYPTVANGTERLEVSFTAPSSKPVQVAVEHHGKTVIGWAGLFVTIAPGWMLPSTYTRRIYDQLGLAITMKGDAILALAGRRGGATKRRVPNQLGREVSRPVLVAQCSTRTTQTR
jgi:hypothetical protein